MVTDNDVQVKEDSTVNGDALASDDNVLAVNAEGDGDEESSEEEDSEEVRQTRLKQIKEELQKAKADIKSPKKLKDTGDLKKKHDLVKNLEQETRQIQQKSKEHTDKQQKEKKEQEKKEKRDMKEKKEQERRDKKEKERKEREEKQKKKVTNTKENENENVLIFRKVPFDGYNCFFDAIGQAEGVNRQSQELRDIVAKKLRSKPEKYQLILDQVKADAKIIKPNAEAENYTVESYAKKISGRLWGGEVEMSILAEELKKYIVVIGPSGLIQKRDGDEKNPVVFILYNGRNHYEGLDIPPGANATKIIEDIIAKRKSVKIVKHDEEEEENNQAKPPIGLLVFACYLLKIQKTGKLRIPKVTLDETFNVISSLFQYLEPIIVTQTSFDMALAKLGVVKMSLQGNSNFLEQAILQALIATSGIKSEAVNIETIRKSVADKMKSDEWKKEHRSEYEGKDDAEKDAKIVKRADKIISAGLAGKTDELDILAKDKNIDRPIVFISLGAKAPIILNGTSKQPPLFIRYNIHGRYDYYLPKDSKIGQNILRKFSTLTFDEFVMQSKFEKFSFTKSYTTRDKSIIMHKELDNDVFPVLKKITDCVQQDKRLMKFNEIFVDRELKIFIKIGYDVYISIDTTSWPLTVSFSKQLFNKDEKKKGWRLKAGKMFDSFFTPITDKNFAKLNSYLIAPYQTGLCDVANKLLTPYIPMPGEKALTYVRNHMAFDRYPVDPAHTGLLKDLRDASTHHNLVPPRKDIGAMINNIVGDSEGGDFSYMLRDVNKEVQAGKLKKRIRTNEMLNEVQN